MINSIKIPFRNIRTRVNKDKDFAPNTHSPNYFIDFWPEEKYLELFQHTGYEYL